MRNENSKKKENWICILLAKTRAHNVAVVAGNCPNKWYENLSSLNSISFPFFPAVVATNSSVSHHPRCLPSFLAWQTRKINFHRKKCYHQRRRRRKYQPSRPPSPSRLIRTRSCLTSDEWNAKSCWKAPQQVMSQVMVWDIWHWHLKFNIGIDISVYFYVQTSRRLLLSWPVWRLELFLWYADKNGRQSSMSAHVWVRHFPWVYWQSIFLQLLLFTFNAKCTNDKWLHWIFTIFFSLVCLSFPKDSHTRHAKPMASGSGIPRLTERGQTTQRVLMLMILR